MNNWNRRVRLFDRETKTMLPTAPMYKVDFFHCRTDTYVLMFSTGLKDKKGVEIYEGDQLKCDQWDAHLIATIEWDKEQCGFILASNDYSYFIDDTLTGWVFKGVLGNFHIIGNIHEKPKKIGGDTP